MPMRVGKCAGVNRHAAALAGSVDGPGNDHFTPGDDAAMIVSCAD